MMTLTHATIALAGTSLILGTADPLTLGLAVIGSQLPDLDTTTSTVGKIFFPLSSFIEDRFPHRTITHSLLATGFLTLISLAVGYKTGHLITSVALPLGHLIACFSDCFTIKGVQLFYPYPAWAVSVSNPRRRLKTGGAGELWVLAISIVLLIAGIYLATGGGISQQISQSLGLKDGVTDLYNQKAGTNQVYATVEGVWASDRSSASGKYRIIGTDGSEFIISDGKGLYKTNEQIIVNKLQTSVGEAATTEIRNLTFNDENPIATLQKLQRAYPKADIFLTGELTVDFPEEVKIAIEPNQMVTAALVGSSLKFSYCGLSRAIEYLREQYAMGAIEVKVVRSNN
jgi:inner membrane protein